MAIVTLTVSDLDLAAGTYKVDFDAKGSELDDGRATAAYFTGFYMNTLINTPDFLNGCISFGQTMIEGLTRTKPDRPHSEEVAKMVVTLTDFDITTGRMGVTLEATGGDVTGESLPTTAQIVGTYIRYLTTDADFRAKVWEFADEFVANNADSTIENEEQRAA
jgi:hypothetical protein